MRQLQSSSFLAICLARLKCFLINIVLINHAATYYNLTEIKKRILWRLSPRTTFLKGGTENSGLFFFVRFGFFFPLKTRSSRQRDAAGSSLNPASAVPPDRKKTFSNTLLAPAHTRTRTQRFLPRRALSPRNSPPGFCRGDPAVNVAQTRLVSPVAGEGPSIPGASSAPRRDHCRNSRAGSGNTPPLLSSSPCF